MLRIVSLAPSNTEILYALGCEENTIAVTKLCDYPETVKEKTRIGTWTETDVAQIAQLKPDLIFTSYYLPPQLQNYTGPGEIYHINPRSLSDVYESIVEVGGFLNKEEKAKEIVEGMKKVFEKIAECCQNHGNVVSVYAEEWWNPPMVSGNWVPEIIEMCGGKAKLAASGYPSRQIASEDVLSANPDMVIAHWCGRAERSDIEKIKQRRNWNHLQAVRNNQVHRIDDSLLNRPGPRLAQGAQAVHRLIHEYCMKEKEVVEAIPVVKLGGS